MTVYEALDCLTGRYGNDPGVEEALGALLSALAAAQKDAERFAWIEENSVCYGGGNGFEIKVFVPFDEEDMGVGIDRAIALSTTKEKK